ncbi:MAG: Valyl-tRNA synthetase [Clostridiales bacterium]|jgi:valyl-tRNA synthetase|nr:Valyl-tRNA synthetase [Clostridiales bacterium]
MGKELEKNYEPDKVEKRLYKKWLDKNYFHAEPDSKKKPYTIVMPPPNITGQLHMGHALDNTLQDILIRWKRMQGFNALWQPGTDHASIATEVKIIQRMKEEGITKEDIGREGFLKKAWEWKDEYGGRIISQLKEMGSSCDWERERFTMDEGCSEAVQEVFLKLHEKGFIYKGARIINWCPICKTTISDAEVEHEEKAGSFWHLKYPIVGTEEFIQLATTRPETMLGDSAVAVNPEDERYKHLIGKNVMLPFVNREIPIISDEYVDKDFGTGVVKITPAHDPNDFEVGVRHNLPQINVMNDDATINELGGKYQGMDRYEARKTIVKDLEELGLLVKIEEHVHNVGTHDRCKTTVEPMIKPQWFVKMEELAQPAINAIKTGELKFVPERFGKVYLNWLENIRDWCISRQLWWGHRIPAYYCDDCGEIIVSREQPESCKCGSSKIRQDEDTLDTWFSSALWPFSTLGWPNETEDFKYFYPTNTLVTGYDIIFFWVVRMVFSGLEHTGKLPFDTVLIHGLIRDSEGRKMSKSLGNGIDPLEVIEKYGADPLRFTLVTGNAPGNDMRFYWERIEASRNFANKVWNASRFMLMNFEKAELKDVQLGDLTKADKWILSKANTLAKEVTDNMDKYELGIAVQKLYDFIWEEFCDWYIEMIKPRLWNDKDSTKPAALWTLKTVLIQSLKLLHPYMPFITEEIFCTVQEVEESIMVSDWPEFKPEWAFEIEEAEVELMKEAIRGIRNVRTEMNVPPSKKAKVIIVSEVEKVRNIFEASKVFFGNLGYASEVLIQTSKEGIDPDAVSVVISDAIIYIPFAELVEIEKEIERLNKEKERLNKELQRVNGMLNNQSFVSKAPQAKLDEETAKRDKYAHMLGQVNERLEHFSK